jgi:hypothetical protein
MVVTVYLSEKKVYWRLLRDDVLEIVELYECVLVALRAV